MQTQPRRIISACEEQGLTLVPDVGIYDSDGTLLLIEVDSAGWWVYCLPERVDAIYNLIGESVKGALDAYISAHEAADRIPASRALEDIRAHAARARKKTRGL